MTETFIEFAWMIQVSTHYTINNFCYNDEETAKAQYEILKQAHDDAANFAKNDNKETIVVTDDFGEGNILCCNIQSVRLVDNKRWQDVVIYHQQAMKEQKQ